MYTVLQMTKISNSIVTEIIINWLYFSFVIFSYTKSTFKIIIEIGVAGGISPTVFWGFLDLLLKAIVNMLHPCSLKQIQSATHT